MGTKNKVLSRATKFSQKIRSDEKNPLADSKAFAIYQAIKRLGPLTATEIQTLLGHKNNTRNIERLEFLAAEGLLSFEKNNKFPKHKIKIVESTVTHLVDELDGAIKVGEVEEVTDMKFLTYLVKPSGVYSYFIKEKPFEYIVKKHGKKIKEKNLEKSFELVSSEFEKFNLLQNPNYNFSAWLGSLIYQYNAYNFFDLFHGITEELLFNSVFGKVLLSENEFFELTKNSVEPGTSVGITYYSDEMLKAFFDVAEFFQTEIWGKSHLHASRHLKALHSLLSLPKEKRRKFAIENGYLYGLE